MSTELEIIATGFFTDKVLDALPYGSDNYCNMDENDPIAFSFNVASTRKKSEEVSEALGCMLYNFKTHRISFSKIDWEVLQEVLSGDSLVYSNIRTLVNNGFTLYLNPSW